VNLQRTLKTRKRSGIKKRTIGDVHQDMNTFSIGAGWYETPLNPNMPAANKFILLETHSGIIANILSDDDPATLYEACIRSATLSLAWAQSIKNKARKGKK
jgi:hypothetical protein